MQQVRASLARRGGAVVTLGPLPETDVVALVTAMVGAPPGDTLRQLTAQAAGNPLYLRELVDSLARERAPASPVGGVSTAQEQLPASLAAVLNDRLSSVSAETAQILRTAALLGAKFTVTDLAVLLRRPVSELAVGLQEAVAARILVGSGAELAFRHQLIRQALYEFLLHPAPGLLERHARDFAKHASLISQILSLLPARHKAGHGGVASSRARAVPCGIGPPADGAAQPERDAGAAVSAD